MLSALIRIVAHPCSFLFSFVFFLFPLRDFLSASVLCPFAAPQLGGGGKRNFNLLQTFNFPTFAPMQADFIILQGSLLAISPAIKEFFISSRAPKFATSLIAFGDGFQSNLSIRIATATRLCNERIILSPRL